MDIKCNYCDLIIFDDEDIKFFVTPKGLDMYVHFEDCFTLFLQSWAMKECYLCDTLYPQDAEGIVNGCHARCEEEFQSSRRV